MRCLRILAAVVPSFVVGAAIAAGCATSEGEKIFFGMEGGVDANGHQDVTAHAEASATHDTGRDTTTPGFDSFVAPPEASPPVDTGVQPDSGFDSGVGLVFFGNPGTSCTTLGAMQGEACGHCGQKTSTCIVRPDGGVPFDAGVDSGVDSGVDAHHVDAGTTDAGAHDAETHDGSSDAHEDVEVAHEAGPKDAGHDSSTGFVWSEWSACTGGVDGGCLPGTQTTQSCGTCGTQTIVCEPDCEYGVTNCLGQVQGGCIPGTVTFTVSAACATDGGIGGTTATCGPTCTTVDAGSACEAPPTTLTISPNAGGEVNTYVNFTLANEKPLVGGGEDNLPDDCSPHASVDNTTLSPFGFVTLTNSSTTLSATVSVWTTQAPGAPLIDTAITAYAQIPNNGALKSCVGVVDDACFDTTDPTSCLDSYGGLMIGDGTAVTIPAGSSIVIFVQDQFNDAADVGAVGVTARTESFQ